MAVLDQTRGSDYAIWCVAALLYVFDAAKLLSPRELLLVEARGARLAAIFSGNPFTLAGRVLEFGSLLRPDRGVLLAPWGQPWAPDAALESAIQAVERLRASLLIPRVLASAGFVLLFVAGPALTLLVGPNAAVVYTAAVLYSTAFTAIGCLWWQRQRFGLTITHSAWVSVEILLCPAFLPNLVRKITGSHLLQADGAQILSATASADVKEEVLARLASRAEELMEAASPDSIEEEQLRSYLGTLRGKP
jgi:hypothetical protein